MPIKKKISLPHYVCTGTCKSVSESSGKCPTPGCPRARNPLTVCHCQDGLHGKLILLNASSKSK